MKTSRFLAVAIAGIMLALMTSTAFARAPSNHQSIAAASYSLAAPTIVADIADVGELRIMPAAEVAVVSLRTIYRVPDDSVMKKPRAVPVVHSTSQVTSTYKTKRIPSRLWRESYRC